MTYFEFCFDRLVVIEGGYVNDPKDPGGETKWGISKRSYPKLDIKNLTKEAALTIYKNDFWDKIHADVLHKTISYQVFDFAVNSGVDTAIRYYQRALGVADDGYWGPVSQAAANNTNYFTSILLLNSERLDYMTRLSNWNSAGKGWAKRISINLSYAAKENFT